eukprot:TRINITY_DN793_c1_g2_i2.p1 TRINITY_DN793_c1_g2~~TRINITY_DN793_c1_g2_i2.p1  ORF type:complete len:256 (+),score=64.73 TRINITY_DN793_c1_g2_i2:86-769(+)
MAAAAENPARGDGAADLGSSSTDCSPEGQERRASGEAHHDTLGEHPLLQQLPPEAMVPLPQRHEPTPRGVAASQLLVLVLPLPLAACLPCVIRRMGGGAADPRFSDGTYVFTAAFHGLVFTLLEGLAFWYDVGARRAQGDCDLACSGSAGCPDSCSGPVGHREHVGVLSAIGACYLLSCVLILLQQWMHNTFRTERQEEDLAGLRSPRRLQRGRADMQEPSPVAIPF